MISLIDRIINGKPGKNTRQLAKERLRVVLIHDRIQMAPEKLKQMEKEILAVISRYVKVDAESVEFALEQRERNSKIIAQIPFEKVHDDDVMERTP